MKKLSILLLFTFIAFSMNAQTVTELKKELASKKDSIAKLSAKASTIQSKINALPGWKKGAFGTIGASLSGFNNWYAKTAPNASAGNIGITVNGFANLINDTFFWKNAIAINLGWVKLDDKSILGDEGFKSTTDVFTLSSLYGKRINKKWALSGLADYRTTLIDHTNNPGFLDIGFGFTWTPTRRFTLVLNPTDYNIIFSTGKSIYSSSPGAKIVADYTAVHNKISVNSNFSMFQSYKNANLSNWNWTNSFGYKLWKGIGLGFDFGLRNNKQEALNNALITDASATFSTLNNKIQSYWLFGMSYSL